MQRLLSVVIVLAVASAALAGCKKKDSDKAAPVAESKTAAPAPATPPRAEPRSLTPTSTGLLGPFNFANITLEEAALLLPAIDGAEEVAPLHVVAGGHHVKGEYCVKGTDTGAVAAGIARGLERARFNSVKTTSNAARRTVSAMQTPIHLSYRVESGRFDACGKDEDGTRIVLSVFKRGAPPPSSKP